MAAKKKSTIVSQQEILNCDSEQLIDLINNSINTKQDELFSKYQAKVETLLEENHRLIESLQLELQEKNDKIESLSEQIMARQRESAMEFASPIRKRKTGRLNQDELAQEREHISFTLDMIELLTGVKVINFENNSTEYVFDIRQTSSTNQGLTMNYQLVLPSEKNPQISYVPTFLDALDGEEEEEIANAKALKKKLSDFLCENLTFPFDALAQFYAKVNKDLNKK
ncbi:hypothetical protein SBY92_000560 [Candida maltosa Xu316]|uniref:Monopolin complex subunit Csm1/Pcs1 C-terminal domain-containing protein n=1 Tax=Candida maltosa (strain Xu316) TaxID=1245528 RepID=M3K397_CANMX|nr:hypothetical protein G210_0111 [Candida maltosa Xu316]